MARGLSHPSTPATVIPELAALGTRHTPCQCGEKHTSAQRPQFPLFASFRLNTRTVGEYLEYCGWLAITMTAWICNPPDSRTTWPFAPLSFSFPSPTPARTCTVRHILLAPGIPVLHRRTQCPAADPVRLSLSQTAPPHDCCGSCPGAVPPTSKHTNTPHQPADVCNRRSPWIAFLSFSFSFQLSNSQAAAATCPAPYFPDPCCPPAPRTAAHTWAAHRAAALLRAVRDAKSPSRVRCSPIPIVYHPLVYKKLGKETEKRNECMDV